MENYYQVLGLKRGADQKEIKRAYFRLIREHTPEKDPQGFEKIRTAYEQLKADESRGEEPYFPPMQTKIEQSFLDQILQARKEQDLTLSRDTAEEARKRFPRTRRFLYEQMLSQRLCHNTGKAVKSAEQLVKEEPDNKWFRRELAVCYLERGYVNKAFPAFVKAYKLGCRDLDFILMFSRQCSEYGEDAFGLAVLLEHLDRHGSWRPDEMDLAQELFGGLLSLSTFSGTREKEVFQALAGFVRTYKGVLREDSAKWAGMIRYGIHLCDYESAALKEGMSLLKELLAHSPEKDRQEIRGRLDDLEWREIESDKKLNRALAGMYHAIFLTQEEVKQYAWTDMRLCMIEERGEILEQEAYLKEQYPEFWEKIRDFLRLLAGDEESISRLKLRLQKEYQRFSGYSGGAYYEWYPQEKARFQGIQIASGEGTYVRQTKKIGRNDPCPCGSGRKFKQCCMSKGIY